jgi:acetyltransferase-like isoleucine patch superfamily enzyme
MIAPRRCVLLSLLLLFSPSYAGHKRSAQVLFVTPGGREDVRWQTINALCGFYGLTCEACTPADAIGGFGAVPTNYPDVLATIVEVSVPGSAAHRAEAIALWRYLQDRHIPALAVCTEPLTFSLADLTRSGETANVKFIQLTGTPLSWRITQANEQVTRELTGISSQITGRMGPSVTVIDPAGSDSRLAPLMLIRSAGRVSYPVYAELPGTPGPVFLTACSPHLQQSAYLYEPDNKVNLINIIPVLTFLRFAGGPYCWHNEWDYANLTIDDPWLIDPYGCLSYSKLLTEMKKTRFHTTIGFIPWNYDRSLTDVVTLFRDHPEYYSLCIHGNDHDHQEFYRYETTLGDLRPAKSLQAQEDDIEQALARMERFRQLTGLDFDPIMIFPHDIAPVQTVELLKQYNYLMTVNSTNVPLDLTASLNPLFHLRSATLEFGNFACVRRCLPRDRSQAGIALDLFLDNPVVFFEHHTLFRDGIGAFNKTAEMVNALQPNTRWVSLGEMARHLYLQRRRPDGDYDVRAFCRSMDLTNDQEHDLTYYVEKVETSNVAVGQVLANGEPHPYVVLDGGLRLTVSLAPRQSCRIDIRYENNLQPARVDISRNDPRANRLRALSDFRDRTLQRYALTRRAVDLYYASGLYRFGLGGAAALCGLLATTVVAGGWTLRRRVSRRSGQSGLTKRKRPVHDGKSSTQQIAADVRLGRHVILRDFVNLYGCEIGDNSRIGTFVEVQKGARIGRNCKIQSHTFVCEGVTIEDNVFIGHNVTFINDRFPSAVREDGRLQTKQDWTCAPTLVKAGASIGSSATILCGVTIGEKALVGAGSVVTKDVPAGATVAGNPARILRTTLGKGVAV